MSDLDADATVKRFDTDLARAVKQGFAWLRQIK
jgi:hypothetical protein